MKAIVMLGILTMLPAMNSGAYTIEVDSNAKEVICGKNCVAHEGNCACDQKPSDSGVNQDIQPSDEKPPRSGLSADQREGIKANILPLCSMENKCSDQKAIDAAKEGRLAAGL